MSFWSSLFGSSNRKATEENASAEIQVNLLLSPDDAPFEIDAKDVRLCFFFVPAKVLGAVSSDYPWFDFARNLLRQLEPALWDKVSKRVETVILGTSLDIDGSALMDGSLMNSILGTLISDSAVPAQSSIYIRIPEINVGDEGKKTVVIGFAFASNPQKLVVSGLKSCVPRGS